eukprot:GHVN01019527.1.p1 GENE.GHVN01019527.1~~GHVN01019527.1.p1  ORF type:complete len:277 (-),score=10.66 GHVN01019527.1:234-1064(-)
MIRELAGTVQPSSVSYASLPRQCHHSSKSANKQQTPGLMGCASRLLFQGTTEPETQKKDDGWETSSSEGEMADGSPSPALVPCLDGANPITNAYGRSAQEEANRFWMPDAKCSVCYKCNAKFHAFRRRHHCRQCGQVFCHSCSSLKSSEEDDRLPPVRLCSTCANVLRKENRVVTGSRPTERFHLQRKTSVGTSALESTSPVNPFLGHPELGWPSVHPCGNQTEAERCSFEIQNGHDDGDLERNKGAAVLPPTARANSTVSVRLDESGVPELIFCH